MRKTYQTRQLPPEWRDCLPYLSPRYRYILEQAEVRTLKSIALELGISQARVSGIRVKAVRLCWWIAGRLRQDEAALLALKAPRIKRYQ